MTGVDYYSTIQSIIEVVTPDTANSNSANSFVQTIGGRCNKGGKKADPGKLNTQIKHLEARVSTLEHTCIGLYLTLCDLAKNLANANDPEIREIGIKMQENFYDGSEAGLDNIAKAGGLDNSKGNPAGGKSGNLGGGSSGGGINRGNITNPSNVDSLQPSVTVGYNSFVDTIRNRTANTYGEEVSSLNTSQNLIRAEYSSSVIITR